MEIGAARLNREKHREGRVGRERERRPVQRNRRHRHRSDDTPFFVRDRRPRRQVQLEPGHRRRLNHHLGRRRRRNRHLVRRVEQGRPDREREHRGLAGANLNARLVKPVGPVRFARGAGVNHQRVLERRRTVHQQEKAAGTIAPRRAGTRTERDVRQRPSVQPQHASRHGRHSRWRHQGRQRFPRGGFASAPPAVFGVRRGRRPRFRIRRI